MLKISICNTSELIPFNPLTSAFILSMHKGGSIPICPAILLVSHLNTSSIHSDAAVGWCWDSLGFTHDGSVGTTILSIVIYLKMYIELVQTYHYLLYKYYQLNWLHGWMALGDSYEHINRRKAMELLFQLRDICTLLRWEISIFKKY